MSKIDQYANAAKKNIKEYKAANWGGIKVQLVTRGILQAAQMANFAKLLRINNDAEMVSLPGVFNLLMRAFPNDQNKQRDIKHAFIKSFGSDSVVGNQGQESFHRIKDSDLTFLREVEGDPSALLDGMIDHIVKSAALIRSATTAGIYDTEGVITSLNTLMGDINKVVSLLSAQGEPQPAPGEEQPGGENPPEEDTHETGIPDEFKDFLAATGKKYGFRVEPGMRGCLEFNPPFRNFPSPSHEFSPDGTHTMKLNTGFSGGVGMKEGSLFVQNIVNALKALEDIQRKYPRNVMP